MNVIIDKTNGLKPINDVVVGDEIWSMRGYSKVVATKPLVASCMSYTNAGIVYGDQTIFDAGRKTLCSEASSVDVQFGPHCERVTHDIQWIVDGLMIGDGSLYDKRDRYLNIGAKDGDYFKSEVAPLIGRKHPSTHGLGWEMTTNIQLNELPYLPTREVPMRYYIGATKHHVASFLRGLFSANGCISNNKVSLRSTCFKLINQVQLMLGSLGIYSYYSYNPPRMVKWRNGDYLSKEAWDLCINRDRNKYLILIGFLQQYKMDKLVKSVRATYSAGTKTNFSVLKTCDIEPQSYVTLKLDNKYNCYWNNCLNVSGHNG